MQVHPEHYKNRAYDSKERFCSYWHQIDEILATQPSSVLEIGVGNGFVSNYLRRLGVPAIALDFDANLRPDFCGDVLKLPFKNESFDTISCCEVLEHLPFENFPRALAELRRVARKHVVFSVPDVTRVYRIFLQLPKLRNFRRQIEIAKHRPTKHEYDGQHYWEIGKYKFSLSRIEAEIRGSGFDILKTYRPFEIVYHRFFVLANNSANKQR